MVVDSVASVGSGLGGREGVCIFLQRRGAVFAIISQVDDFTQLLASVCVFVCV